MRYYFVIIGFPSLYGGAGAELYHQIPVWEELGVKLHCIPTQKNVQGAALYLDMLERGHVIHEAYNSNTIPENASVILTCSRQATTRNDRSKLVSASLGTTPYAYAYDNIGNRETAQEAAQDVTSYATNTLNQYSSITQGTETPFAPEYDTAGNQTKVKTSTGIWTLAYDANNRPTSFTSEDGQTLIACGYDYMGRRFMKKVTVGEVITLHQFYLYRGYLQIAALDLTRSTLNALWFVHWDPTEPVATRPLSIRKNATWYTYGHDLTKNVTEFYKVDGTIATAYDYTPYGAVTATGIDQPFQWSSEVYDAALGMVYYNYRHYNPSDGRWIGRDMIAERSGGNLYSYIRNKSVEYYDYIGLSSEGSETQTKKCCENGVVVEKVKVYIINRSGGQPNTGTTGGHIDMIFPGAGLVGYFETGNEGVSGMGLNGQFNNNLQEWLTGAAARPSYVVGKQAVLTDANGNRIKIQGYLSTICEITVCPEQAKRMTIQASQIGSNPGTFNIAGNNCASQACAILGSGGIMSGGISGLDTPQNLIEQLQQNYSADCYYGYTQIDPQTGKASVIKASNAPAVPSPPESASN